MIVWHCDSQGATGLADRIRREFAAMAIDGLSADIRLTASFGLAQMQRGEGYGKLFARADAALYRAKEAGRDRVVADGQTNEGTNAIAAIGSAARA